jgi:hypothetical protein
MSPSKNDRTIQSFSGIVIQVTDNSSGEPPLSAARLAAAISAALHREYGETHAAIKHIVRATGANERAARNWFDGKNAPNGESLIALCRNCDHVLEAVLILAGRNDILSAKRLVDAKEKLRDMLKLIDELGIEPK